MWRIKRNEKCLGIVGCLVEEWVAKLCMLGTPANDLAVDDIINSRARLNETIFAGLVQEKEVVELAVHRRLFWRLDRLDRLDGLDGL